MSNNHKGWVGVDLDGTLAQYDGWVDAAYIGPPVPAMVNRVRDMLDAGQEVRIFTARVYPLLEVIHPGASPLALYTNAAERVDLEPTQRAEDVGRITTAIRAAAAIQAWCQEHLGRELPLTCIKDYGMITLYDDRAIQVRKNTGELVA